jgi:hypothetical protein
MFGRTFGVSATLCLLALVVPMVGCGNSSTGPSSSPYDGSWNGSGQTTQDFGGLATRITFTVSGATITNITVQYTFTGCSGSRRFPNLNITLDTVPGAPNGTVERIADLDTGPAGAADSTHLHFHFTSATTVSGVVLFVNYSDCGNGGIGWIGSKTTRN